MVTIVKNSIDIIEIISNLGVAMNAPFANQPPDKWLELVAAQVAALRYGVVQVVVHDGRVVQIECTERLRLDKPEPRTT